ncbi:hypothetical protein JB92DRAFT_3125294 [Gautieria morchelliformis]|nr:hypothetical protein JB92DRAFT_3125294 [Gautieria morchelliformis]
MLQTMCSVQFAITGSTLAAHAFIFLFYVLYDIAFTPLIVSYTVEILACSIHTKGFNIFNFMIAIKTPPPSDAPLGNAIIFNHTLESTTSYDCWLLFQLVFCYLFIVEMRNSTLKETHRIFDEESMQGMFSQAAAVTGLADTRESELDEN